MVIFITFSLFIPLLCLLLISNHIEFFCFISYTLFNFLLLMFGPVGFGVESLFGWRFGVEFCVMLGFLNQGFQKVESLDSVVGLSFCWFWFRFRVYKKIWGWVHVGRFWIEGVLTIFWKNLGYDKVFGWNSIENGFQGGFQGRGRWPVVVLTVARGFVLKGVQREL